jgi:hypothetical protein
MAISHGDWETVFTTEANRMIMFGTIGTSIYLLSIVSHGFEIECEKFRSQRLDIRRNSIDSSEYQYMVNLMKYLKNECRITDGVGRRPPNTLAQFEGLNLGTINSAYIGSTGHQCMSSSGLYETIQVESLLESDRLAAEQLPTGFRGRIPKPRTDETGVITRRPNRESEITTSPYTLSRVRDQTSTTASAIFQKIRKRSLGIGAAIRTVLSSIMRIASKKAKRVLPNVAEALPVGRTVVESGSRQARSALKDEAKKSIERNAKSRVKQELRNEVAPQPIK